MRSKTKKRYRLSPQLKRAVKTSGKREYVLAQAVNIDRAVFSLFMNEAYISEFYKNKIIELGSLLDIGPDQCVEAIED